MTTHVTLHNISVAYPYATHTALSSVSLSIMKGEHVGLLGPNGSGKTTLLHTLSGIITPTEGSISLLDSPLTSLSAKDRAKQIASVPQRMPDPPHIPSEMLVLMGRYPHTSFWNGYSEQDKQIAQRAMLATHTAHLSQRYSTELSGGEFQRVLIARALAQNAPMLLLDEATSGLDIARKIEIFDLLATRNRQKGTTIVSAIHDLNLAALYCQRLIFLKKGNVVLDGPVKTVFTAAALSDIYETPMTVFSHPVTHAPQACFVPAPHPATNTSEAVEE